MTKSEVPFLSKNNINKAFNARLEIIYVHSHTSEPEKNPVFRFRFRFETETGTGNRKTGKNPV